MKYIIATILFVSLDQFNLIWYNFEIIYTHNMWNRMILSTKFETRDLKLHLVDWAEMLFYRDHQKELRVYFLLHVTNKCTKTKYA